MKYLFINLLFTTVFAASAAAQVASDGYKFAGNPPPLRHEFKVNIIEYDSPKLVADAVKSYGVTSPRVHAFSVYDPVKDTCNIHIVKPAKSYMPEHIGHELVHCIYGAWHK